MTTLSPTDEAARTIHLVVAGPLDQHTGGYLYDARMVAGLRDLGRTVDVLEIAGRWPVADAAGRADLARRLAAVPDGAVVVVDGLVGGAVPDVLEAEAERLRLVPLVHHPLCDEGGGGTLEAERLEVLEARTLQLGRGVIVTSRFTRDRVIEMGADPARVGVVEPGTEAVERVAPSEGPTGAPVLLCVGSVVPRKGQLDLVRALGALTDLPWRCVLVGSLERDVGYAQAVREALAASPAAERIHIHGEVGDAELETAWSEADLFVLPSRYEGYGMAFTEALVRGLPVVGTTGGAIPFTVPSEVGCLVPPGDVDSLAAALRAILTDPERRARMAERSRVHAASLPSWGRQVARFAEALDAIGDAGGPGAAVSGDAPESAERHDVFTSDWLTLREPADHAARSDAFAVRLAEVATERRWSTVLDMGTGRGSNLRWLAPRLPGVQRWVALDHDAALLREIEDAWDAPESVHHGTLRTVEGDLAGEGLAEVDRADIVTASALLDLVTETWVQDLAGACADRGAAALLALSWDGTATLHPADPVSDEILDAVRVHQQGEKGMGVALGPTAPEVTAAAFRAVGMEVETASTPWCLRGSADGPLILALVEGWVDAACEIVPGRAEAFRGWLEGTRAELGAGDVEITVGHVDLLALPAPTQP